MQYMIRMNTSALCLTSVPDLLSVAADELRDVSPADAQRLDAFADGPISARGAYWAVVTVRRDLGRRVPSLEVLVALRHASVAAETHQPAQAHDALMPM